MPSITGPRPTTFVQSGRLSEQLGADVVVASETFQWTGSFKFRAAYHVATHIPHPRLITESSGNFGQAIALACRLAGKGCIVVMPTNSARVKVDAVRGYGATVDLVDTAVATREARVTELAARDPEAYVASAFDDPLVIAGNASMGRELAALNARTDRPLDAILVAIGGGGLASGILAGLRDAGDHTPVWGIEPAAANDFVRSLAAGHRIVAERDSQTIADGARVRSVGTHNWALLQPGLAGAVEVSEDAIVEGVRLLFGLANLKVEPTGAVTVAALLTEPDRWRGQRVCCIASGGNVDPELYARILAPAATPTPNVPGDGHKSPVLIVLADRAEQLDDARSLFREYWDSFGFTPCFQGFDAEVAELPGTYAPPDGRLALCFIDGTAAGCVALRRVDPVRCEMKRLYVRPAFRRRGVARALLDWVIAAARAAGYREMLADTMPVMQRALDIYDRIGFERTPAYAAEPTPGAVYLRLNLHND